jgi:DMSO/TMAO reductase YedYZ molybdopterin-dependent catalytic subunit
MVGGFISRGFHGRGREPPELAARIPPGQYLTEGFPVLSAGPTPRTRLEQWDLRVFGEIAQPRRWTWDEFFALPERTSRSTSTA